MRQTCSLLRSAEVLLLLIGTALLHSPAQTFAATVGTTPVLGAQISSPRPLQPQHPRDGEENLMYARVRNGVYSVDGLVGKLRLNYDIKAAGYMYMFVPGLGTAVIATAPDPDAISTKATFKNGELRFLAADHTFLLTGLAVVNGKGQTPEHLYVRFDRAAWDLSRLPMLGYGKLAEAPYEWPGAMSPQVAEDDQEPMAPPVPTTLLPSRKPVTPVSVDPASLRSGGLRPASMR